MGMNYDRDLFKKFKDLAVTKVEDLKIGHTYYSNSETKPIKIKALLTIRELNAKRNLPVAAWEVGHEDEVRWIEAEDGDVFSLRDRNIGGSYNPWLIFDNEDTCLECQKEMPVEFFNSELRIRG